MDELLRRAAHALVDSMPDENEVFDTHYVMVEEWALDALVLALGGQNAVAERLLRLYETAPLEDRMAYSGVYAELEVSNG